MATRQIALTNTLSIAQRRLFLDYARDCATRNSGALSSFRAQLLFRDRAYQRQLDVTAEHIKAVRGNLAGDARKLQNMTVPIVMPQIESAVAYQAGVFLTSYPIFGVVSYPKNMSAALQFETTLADQSIRYGWARELIKVFRDGFKYNFGPAVCLWKKTPISRIATDTSTDASLAGRATIENSSYGANMIKRVDPYNCFMDMTVSAGNMHTDGEYFGWNEIISRVSLKRMLQTLDSQKTTSLNEAFSSNFAGATQAGTDGLYYNVPRVNQMMDLGTAPYGSTGNWGQWAGMVSSSGKIEYRENYLVTHFLCRALPSDFNSGGNTAKIYHAIIINWQHVVFVEELNVGHDFLPAFIMQPNEDGLGYQTQSMLDSAMPFQDMSSALWNASLESKRRQVFDRLIYNPRMIDKKDIDPASAVARIPLRNVNMGKEGNPMASAIYQIPYRDDNTAGNLQMAQMISGMADEAVGQNKVDRGQFQPGNKTRTEFSQTMANSNSRQQLVSLTVQGQFITPLKETIKSNTLQHQSATTILNQDRREEITIDPVELRKSILEFKMTDGMLPSDKMMNPEVLMVLMQTAQAMPGIATEYDVMGMFMYWAKLQGATWLEDFKRDPQQQQQFLQTVQQTTAANTPPAPAQPAPAQ